MPPLRFILRPLTVALLVLATVGAGPPAADTPPPAAIISADVTFDSGQRTIGGTVYLPQGDHVDLPGLVLVAGAGEGLPREVYRPVAEAFAEAGIATLVYDKRGPEEGYSMFDASFADLAEDAAAGARLLGSRPEVDSGRVGLHGHSEGGWTVLEAAAGGTDIAFVVFSGASALSPERTQIWMNETQLREAGVAPRLARSLGGSLTRQVVALDAFRLHGHDPLPTLQRLDQPLLGVFAEYDRSAPPGESLEMYREALEAAGHPHYALRVLRGVGHGMEPSEDGFVEADADLATLFGDLDPQYVTTVSEWVHASADEPPGPRVDPAPAQRHTSAPVEPPTGMDAPAVHLAALGVVLVAFGSYPLTAIAARVRRRGQAPPGRGAARWLALSGLAVPPLALLYLLSIMLTAGTAPGPVVAGRPVVWLLLQGAALGVPAAAAVLAVRGWRARHHTDRRNRARLITLLVGGAVFVPWAAAWGLFTL